MSRASNLAGFTTAVGPPTDLNVGVVTAISISAQTITSTDTYSFTNLDIGESISVGSSTVGVTTINSSGINSPLGIGTFDSIGIGTDNVGGSKIIAASKGYTTVSIRTDDDATGFPLLQFIDNRGGGSYQIEGGRYDGKFSIRTNSSIVANNQKDRIILDESGNVGLGSTSPTVSVDISEKTDAVALPVGTTAQRPSTAYGGYIRWNSTSSALEVYNGTNWVEIISDYFPSGSTTLG